MKRIELLLLVLILIGGFVVRLYRFNGPIADWHSWRQADTSAVSRNFIAHGFDVLHPQYDDISNVQTGFDNPKGYRFVEFPLYNIAQASLANTFHFLTLEEWGRIVTIIATVLSTLFIFLLCRRYANSTVAIAAAFFFAFLPYSVYYGRTILPDPSQVMTTLGAIYFFSRWVDSLVTAHKLHMLWLYVVSVLFAIAALLFKPFAIFFLIPPCLYIAWNKWGMRLFTQWKLYLFLILSVVPLALWRLWMTQYPEGIPVNTWLFNGGNIRFKGAFFYWIFADRLARLLLGYWGLALFVIGIIAKQRKHTGFFLSFIISSLLYVIIVARGNVQHDYYQILLLPTVAIYLGLGIDFLLHVGSEHVSRVSAYSIVVVASFFSLFFGWYFVRDYFNINNPSIVAAGIAVDKLTPRNAKVIAPYDGDTSFLYQTKRKGWPSFEKSLPELVQMGADYLVLVNPSPRDADIGKTYKIVAATPQYILFNLHQK